MFEGAEDEDREFGYIVEGNGEETGDGKEDGDGFFVEFTDSCVGGF